MSSTATKNRKRAHKEISTYGELQTTSTCARCFLAGLDCVTMSGHRSIKCANCANSGKSCVNVSWEWLDKERERRAEEVRLDKEKLKLANEEVRKMMAEVVRRQNEAQKLLDKIDKSERVLSRVHERAKAKTACLIDELDEEEKEERARKRKRGEAVSPEPLDFSSILGVTDGSNQVDWNAWDVPGGTGQDLPEGASDS